jgi:hypothetical protein
MQPSASVEHVEYIQHNERCNAPAHLANCKPTAAIKGEFEAHQTPHRNDEAACANSHVEERRCDAQLT